MGAAWQTHLATDILIQQKTLQAAAAFYVDHLGFTITDEEPGMISLPWRGTSTCSSRRAPPIGAV